MDRALYVAAATTSALIDKQAINAQNMANVSTPGFKRLFEQQISWKIPEHKGGELETRIYAPQITPGVDVSSGVIVKTDDPLNIAIPKGFFLGVVAGNGEVAYTKRGDFIRDEAGVLKLGSGQEVQSAGGGQIVLPENMKVEIAKDGTVFGIELGNPANRSEIGQLRIVRSENSEVTIREDGLLNLNENTLEDVNEGFELKSGVLEQSNVSMATAMAEMISTSRMYDFNAKVIQTISSKEQNGIGILSNWR